MMEKSDKLVIKLVSNHVLLKRVKKNLILGISKKSGHNFYGRITVFCKGGLLKLKQRVIDFRRICESDGLILSIEKDWKRTGFVGLVYYSIGLFSYILLEDTLKMFSVVYKFPYYKIERVAKGMSFFLKDISVGSPISHIELIPGKGAQLCRSAGARCFIFSRDFLTNLFVLKLRSGVLMQVSSACVGMLGLISNSLNNQIIWKKAGFSRKMGVRPTVRGVAMNPCDHPHGGGEGKKSQLAAPKTPWGKLSKSVKTRNKKYKKLKRWI